MLELNEESSHEGDVWFVVSPDLGEDWEEYEDEADMRMSSEADGGTTVSIVAGIWWGVLS